MTLTLDRVEGPFDCASGRQVALYRPRVKALDGALTGCENI